MSTVATHDDSGGNASTGNSDANADPRNIGFGPAWRRFLLTGLYNSDWASTPPDVSQELDAVNNPVPYWAGPTTVSGTSCRMRVVADTTTGSGYSLQLVLDAGAADDCAYLEQWVPVTGSNDRSRAWVLTTFTTAAWANAGAGRIWAEFQFFKSDAATTTGSAIAHEVAAAGNNTTVQLNGSAPSDAYWARVRVGVKRVTAGTVTDTALFTLAEVVFSSNYQYLAIPDSRVAATYSPGWIYQDTGQLVLAPNAYGTGVATSIGLAAGTGPGKVIWDGAAITFPNSATLTSSAAGRTILAAADLDAHAGVVITHNKAGAAVDGDFLGAAVNGGLQVDSTNNKIWARTSAGWKGVAVAGLSVPRQERRCPRCLRLLEAGDELAPVVNEVQSDRARHALYAHRSCGLRWRVARALRLAPDHTAWYTAALRRVDAAWTARHPVPEP